MNTLVAFYYSSIGKKITVGLTGFLLCLYLIVHLGGNLLLFRNDGGQAFNTYAEILPSLLIIRIIEIILFLIFIVHIVTTTYVWIQNKRARGPEGYKVNHPQANSSFFSRWMFVTGSIVFIFIVIHMSQFWYPSRFAVGEVSMYNLVRAAFTDPFYAILYIIAMVLLAFHLRHGFQSAFQTFGWRTKKYVTTIEAFGVIFWLLIPLAFACIPAYFLLFSR